MTDTSIDQRFGTALAPAEFEVRRSADQWQVICSGDWDISGIADIDEELRAIENAPVQSISIDTSLVGKFDTAGAWLIERLRRSAEDNKFQFQHVDSNQRHIQLAQVVRGNTHTPEKKRGLLDPLSVGPVEAIGRLTVSFWQDFLMISNIIGAAVRGPQMKAGKSGGIRLLSIINQLDHMALRAVPVIAVMSFLIGAIIAQQGAFQLKAFGEELLTVNLVGILLLREIGVLRARDMPEVEVILVEEHEPEGPFGAKGVGEIGLVPTAGAVASALFAFDGEHRFRLPMKDSPAGKAMSVGKIRHKGDQSTWR